MKHANVRDVQHNLAEVLSWVERGEEVQIYRRKKLVARILPPHPKRAESPDFVERARQVWGSKPKGNLLSEVASEDRGDR